MKKILFIYLLMVFVAGCQPAVESSSGFSLPVGDKVEGKALYDRLQCAGCHLIASNGEALDVGSSTLIPIGGETTRVRTYAELVTSIINPSHEMSEHFDVSKARYIGESNMRNFNDLMTVSELIHLVAYLESKYQLVPYDPTSYQNFVLPNQ